MIVYMAHKMSSLFISKDIIKEDERQIYDYCFEILLSTAVNFLILIALSVISGTVVPTICFMIGFMAVRMTAGGFHAETHGGCLLILLVAYSSYLMMLLLSQNTVLRIATVVFLIMTFLLVIIFSPVEDHNKPFSEEEYKRFKRESYCTILLLTVIAGVCVLIVKKVEWGFSISAGMFVVAVSLVAGYVKNRVMKEKGINNAG